MKLETVTDILINVINSVMWLMDSIMDSLQKLL